MNLKSHKVSIIIPVFNKFEFTYNCLLSIQKNTDLATVQIIIADDCSEDETKNITKYFDNVIVVKTESRRGFLGNCNNAAKYASGEYILFLNNDTEVTNMWMENLFKVMENNKEVVIVGSKLIFPDGKLQEAGGIIWKDGRGHNYGRGDDPNKPEYNYVKEVDYCSGACILVRKSFWEEVGGFDETFTPAYYEDTDLSFQARKKGYKVVYQPLSVVLHHESISNKPTGMKTYLEVNRHKFYSKWKDTLETEHFHYFEDIFLARDRSKDKTHILIILNEYVNDIIPLIKQISIPIFQLIILDSESILSDQETIELQQIGVEVRNNFDFKSYLKYIDSIIFIGTKKSGLMIENLILAKKSFKRKGKLLKLIQVETNNIENNYRSTALDRYIDLKTNIYDLYSKISFLSSKG